MSATRAPADRVTPVSQAGRSSADGTYSFWWRSARGTMKPVNPRWASSVRSALTRGALAAPSGASSNDWKRASNMGGTLWAMPGGGNGPHTQPPPLAGKGAGGRAQHQCHPAVEVNAALEHHSLGAVGRERGTRLRRQQAGKDHASVRGCEPRDGGCHALQGLKKNIGEDEIERRARADWPRLEAIGPDGLDQPAPPVDPCLRARGVHRAGVVVARQRRPPQR